MASSIYRTLIALLPLLAASTALEAWFYDTKECDYSSSSVKAIKMNSGADDMKCHRIGEVPTTDDASCGYYLDANWDDELDCGENASDDGFEARSYEINFDVTTPGTDCWLFSEPDCNGDANTVGQAAPGEPRSGESGGSSLLVQTYDEASCYPSLNPWNGVTDNFKSFKCASPEWYAENRS